MEHAKRVAQRYSFIIFFMSFGIIAIIINSVVSRTENYGSVLDNIASLNSALIHTPIDANQYHSQIKNALIMVPETNIRISLVDGRASYGTDTDGGDVTLIRPVGGIVISEQVSHVFADIAVQSGGTGVFHYLALFQVVDGKVTHTSSYFIGDRVVIDSVSVASGDAQSYVVQVNYLDREFDQAMVDDPTVPRTLDIPVHNALFVESGL